MKKEKLKIAFLSFYSGEVYRGAETFVHELANRLTDLGHDITVYQNGPKLTDSKYKTVSVGLPIEWNKKPFGIPFANYWSLLIKKFTGIVLKEIDFDTDIVFPANGQWESTLCKLWAVKHRKKVIISGQSGKGLEDRLNLYTFPDAFVPITSHALRHSKARNPFVRLSYIPNGVDLDEFRPAGKSYNTKLHKPIILTVGALTKSKRIDLVIKATAKLAEANLLIVGDGEERQNLTKLANDLIPDRFEFVNVKHDEMPEIYRSADLFVLLPRSSEAFGIVYVEAMASGLPVVASADEQRREIVGPAGILVEHASEPEDIAFAIEEALKRNWGETPRNQAKLFSWDEITRKYEKLFHEIVVHDIV